MTDVTSTLQDFLAEHGVRTVPESDGWLSTGGEYPAARAYTDQPQFQEGGCKMRLDVEVALSTERLIIESFADFGADPDEAFRLSLQNFCTGSFHVMLSGLWGITDADQVLVERVTLGKQTWVLHIGNLVRKAAGGMDVPPPDDLMPIFDGIIQRLNLPSSIHWGRIFYANMPNRDAIVEVLFDNEVWTAGEDAIRGASWPRLDTFYSTRMFWIMVPQNEAV